MVESRYPRRRFPSDRTTEKYSEIKSAWRVDRPQYPGDVGVLLITGDLSVQQLQLHLVHERSAVGVGEDGLVVDGVVVHELNVTHTGRPVDILQSPFDPGRVEQ